MRLVTLLVGLATSAQVVADRTFESAISEKCATFNTDASPGPIEITFDCNPLTPYTDLINKPLPDNLPTSCQNIKEQIVTFELIDCDNRGNFPVWISELTGLKDLRLEFDDSVKYDISNAFDGLSGLTHFKIWGNGLSGDIMNAIKDCAELVSVSIIGNELTGEITSAFKNKANLEILYINGKKLTGDITSAFDDLPLVYLSIVGCKLKGDTDEVIRKKGLTDNSYSFTGPKLEGSTVDKTSLDCPHDSFESAIDAACTAFDAQTPTDTFDIDFNCDEGYGDEDLKGTPLPDNLPDSCQNKKENIVGFYLRNCQTTGKFPEWISELTGLTTLQLTFDDGVKHDITHVFDDLNRLTGLTIWGNGLIGDVTNFVRDKAGLIALSIVGNKLTGDIMNAIKDYTELVTVGIEGNELTGDITSAFKNKANLEILYIYGNKLTGNITSAFDGLRLSYLTIAGCRFTGDADKVIETLELKDGRHRFTGPNLEGSIVESYADLNCPSALKFWRSNPTA